MTEGEVSGGAPALLIGFGAGLNLAGQVVLLPSRRSARLERPASPPEESGGSVT